MILGAVAERSDITLAELRELLAGHGVSVGIATLWRFFARRKITLQKKSGHAAEQDRPHVTSRREAWFEGRLDLDPRTLGFIDETRATIGAVMPDSRSVPVNRPLSITATTRSRRSTDSDLVMHAGLLHQQAA